MFDFDVVTGPMPDRNPPQGVTGPEKPPRSEPGPSVRSAEGRTDRALPSPGA
ncbi:MAG: hypothetical protein ACK5YI_11100 [Rhodospirillales bacterium]|jgi:hypothetical protein